MSTAPNILLIHAESMDGRLMGCMGHPALQRATPNLDRLAEQGVMFRNAYSTCPVCNPSRASMWSGTYPHHYECWNNNAGLDPNVATWQDLFEAAGYRFANFGKLDFRDGAHSIRDQVGSWTRTALVERPLNKVPLPLVIEEEKPHAGDWAKADQLIAEMRDAAQGDQPFFCMLSTSLVHAAFVSSPEYMSRIDADKICLPPGLRPVEEEPHPMDRYTRITKGHANAMAPELVRQIRHVYFAMIAELDDIVGRILAAVDELGLRDNTWIVFASDHGEMAGEHNQVLKRTHYEPSIRVPLIISGPGGRQGATVDTPVSLIDFYPTFLDMAGLHYDEWATDDGEPDQVWAEKLMGESLLPQLTSESPRQRDWAFAEYHGDRVGTGAFMLRRSRWKLIHYVGYEPQLFDLEADPWEMDNRAEAEPEIVAELMQILSQTVDCEAVHRRAVAYDKRRFRDWRDQAKREGSYAATMATVYSGFNRACLDDYRCWSDENERQLDAWLEDAE